MRVKLKILSGALALNEFTVGELARYAGVKEQSVRTVLDREQTLFEELRKEKTGRRGGSMTVHRLRPDRTAALEDDIGKIYNDLPAKNRVEDSGPALLALDVAEELLTRHFGEASDIEKRDEIIKLATKQIEAVRGDIPTSATDVLRPHMIEKINQRLAMLDAARSTCVELIDRQRRMAEYLKEIDEMRKKIKKYVARQISTTSMTRPQPAYANAYAPALAGSLRGCDVVLVATADGAVANSVRDISKQADAHFVDLSLDPDDASNVDLVMKHLKTMKRPTSGNKRGLLELVYAVDTSKHSSPLLLAILKKIAAETLGATEPVVLDTSFDATLRNAVFSGGGLYAGNAGQLDSGAMRQMVCKPFHKPVSQGLVAAIGNASPLLRS